MRTTIPKVIQAFQAGEIAQLLSLSIWFSLLQASADRALLALGDSRSLAFSNIVKAVFTIGGTLGGYALAGINGFILGLALGALAVWVVVLAR